MLIDDDFREDFWTKILNQIRLSIWENCARGYGKYTEVKKYFINYEKVPRVSWLRSLERWLI